MGGTLSAANQEADDKIGEMIAKLPAGYRVEITGPENNLTYTLIGPSGVLGTSTGAKLTAVRSIYTKWQQLGL